MKSKILLIGWSKIDAADLLKGHLKPLSEKFEIIFAHYDVDALHEIALAKFNHNAIKGIVFGREMLVEYKEQCKLINKFAIEYSFHKLVTVSLIDSNADTQAKKDEIPFTSFVFTGDWMGLKKKFDKIIKKELNS